MLQNKKGRSVWTISILGAILVYLPLAHRALRRNDFTDLAVLTLALVIGILAVALIRKLH